MIWLESLQDGELYPGKDDPKFALPGGLNGTAGVELPTGFNSFFSDISATDVSTSPLGS